MRLSDDVEVGIPNEYEMCIRDRSDNDRARFELAAIVDSAHAAIISKDLHGNVTSWNRAATEIFGFTRAEMIGQPITRIIPLDLFEDEIAIMESCLLYTSRCV